MRKIHPVIIDLLEYWCQNIGSKNNITVEKASHIIHLIFWSNQQSIYKAIRIISQHFIYNRLVLRKEFLDFFIST